MSRRDEASTKTIVKNMIQHAKLTNQKELAKMLDLTEPALSRYKANNNLPFKKIERFLELYPSVSEDNILGKKTKHKDIKEDIFILSSIVENAKNEKIIREKWKELLLNQSEMIENIINYKYKDYEISGKAKIKYFSPSTNIYDYNIKFVALGYCLNGGSKTNGCCLNCDNFITSVEFIPFIDFFNGYMEHLIDVFETDVMNIDCGSDDIIKGFKENNSSS